MKDFSNSIEMAAENLQFIDYLRFTILGIPNIPLRVGFSAKIGNNNNN